MSQILWYVVFAGLAAVLVAWFVLTHVYFRALSQFVASTFLGRGSSPAVAQAVAKKIIYGVAVVFLFTYAYVWRSVIVDPVGRDAAVREQELGDVHLTGSLVRLGLGGFRGVTTCYLWNLAMDKQMKNQLNELEVIVGWLTDLQPHFNTPWLFQAWNFAYNVSNKTDQPGDKYFWITRGIQLLADGERQNRDNPDLRFELGTTFQHKICQSDETNYTRSLFQLSLIPPNERDPAHFRDKSDRYKIDSKVLGQFCRDHPQLIRRLREGIHKDSLYEQHRLFTCATPEELLRFLGDNYRVPSLFTEDPDKPGTFKLDKPLARFPVLPPPPGALRPHPFMADGDMTERDLLTDALPLGQTEGGKLDDWDAFKVAGAWYGYAQEPLPPPSNLPGKEEPIVDRLHQHLNQHMMTIIFRHYPARAQSYVAERLEEEGWFDDVGWTLDWIVDKEKKLKMVIGANQDWAVKAWSSAYKMWEAHGTRNHLLLTDDAERNNKTALAEKYRLHRGLSPHGALPPVEDDPQRKEEWEAAQFMALYESARNVSAFSRNYSRANVERDSEVVRVRALFYDAQAYALTGSTDRALNCYRNPKPDVHAYTGPNPEGMSALDSWAMILADPKHAEFRHDDLTAEETYEIELDLQDLILRALPENELKVHLGEASLAGPGDWLIVTKPELDQPVMRPGLGGVAVQGLNVVGLLEAGRPRLFPPVAFSQGPFDQMTEENKTLWISEGVKKNVQERRRMYQPRKKDTVETGTAPPQPKGAAPGAPGQPIPVETPQPGNP